jgi:predicted nuclease with TOPRIM domain
MASDNTKRGRGRPKKEYSEEAKDSLIKHFHKELLDSQSESDNLEVHVKRLMLEKAELNDKIEQLTDDVRKYEELYVRAKGVAQALGRAVSILTTENKHG